MTQELGNEWNNEKRLDEFIESIQEFKREVYRCSAKRINERRRSLVFAKFLKEIGIQPGSLDPKWDGV